MAYLRERGLRILDLDWRCRLGQVDIVCEDGDVLVVVEVKARRSAAFGPPQEAVDWRKQEKLRALLHAYMAATGRRGRRCRIDVVAVLLDADLDPLRIDHIVSAVGG